jgi:hypothetical protein
MNGNAFSSNIRAMMSDGAGGTKQGLSNAQWTAESAAGVVQLCLFGSDEVDGNFGEPNVGTAHEVIVHCASEEFTLHADFTKAGGPTVQNNAFTKEAYAVSSIDYNDCEYTITVPNETSFPGKTCCLCQVQSLFHRTYGDAVAYVIIPEISSHNNFIQGRRVVGALPSSWSSQSSSSLLNTGTMCQNSFGTQLKVKNFDVNTHKILGTDQRHSQGHKPINNVIEKWPTTVVLRLLFLENEDLKDF